MKVLLVSLDRPCQIEHTYEVSWKWAEEYIKYRGGPQCRSDNGFIAYVTLRHHARFEARVLDTNHGQSWISVKHGGCTAVYVSGVIHDLQSGMSYLQAKLPQYWTSLISFYTKDRSNTSSQGLWLVVRLLKQKFNWPCKCTDIKLKLCLTKKSVKYEYYTHYTWQGRGYTTLLQAIRRSDAV